MRRCASPGLPETVGGGDPRRLPCGLDLVGLSACAFTCADLAVGAIEEVVARLYASPSPAAEPAPAEA